MPRLLKLVGLAVFLFILPMAARAQGLKWSMLLENGNIGENTAAVFNNKLFVYDHSAGKLYHSNNGSLWYEDAGLTSDYGSQILVFNGKLFHYCDYSRYSENGSSWSAPFSMPPLAPDDYYFRAAPLGSRLWLFKQDGSMWNSPDGFGWQKILGAAPWAGRKDFALVSFGGKIFLIGGMSTSFSFYNDVWSTTDGTTWNQDVASAPWTARRKMALLVFENKLWMFGGDSPSGPLNEVWTSTNGVTWTRNTSRMIWSPRFGHSVTAWNNVFYIVGGLEKWDAYQVTKQSVWASIANASDAAADEPLNFSVERATNTWFTLRVKNTGTTTWLGGTGGHRLRMVLDPDKVWNGTAAQEIVIPAGASIAPGQTYAFTVPIKTAGLTKTVNLVMQMYSPTAMNFGDRLACSLTPSYPVNMMWRKVTPVGFNDDRLTNLAVFNGKLWADNQCTTDGTNWVTAGDYTKAPWLNRNYFAMCVFKDKLWVGGGYNSASGRLFDMWSSPDGVTWTNEGTSNENSTIHNQSFVFKEKLWKSYMSDYDLHWSSDGKSWTYQDSHNYSADSKYVVFKDQVWQMAGGTTQFEQFYSSGNLSNWSYRSNTPSHYLWENGVTVYHDRLWILGGWMYDNDWDYARNNKVWSSDGGQNWDEATPLPFNDHDRVRAVTWNDAIWLFVWRNNTIEIWRGTPFEPLVPSTRFIDMGMQDINAGPGAAKTVILYNRNTSPVWLKGAGAQFLGANADAFQVSGVDLQTPVPVGGSRTLSITFDPSKAGLTTATLRISYDAPYSPMIDVALTGVGTLTGHGGKYLGILNYLLGYQNDDTGLDMDKDNKITVADLIAEPGKTIPVSAPAKNALWPMGSTQTVKWTVKSSAGTKVDLALYRNHVYYKPIASDEANDGSFEWVVNNGVNPGGDYTIAVLSASEATIAGESPAFFSIQPENSSIRLKTPNGGERYRWGDACEIKWTAPASITKLRISLYKNWVYYDTIDNEAANDGSYTWHIPENLPQASNYQIFLADNDDRDVRDASDQTFTILNP